MNLDYVKGLYEKWAPELIEVRAIQKERHAEKFKPAFDDVESELLYMLVRETQPVISVEISPNFGWSSTWILEALKRDGFGNQLHSYDIHDGSVENIPDDLRPFWKFHLGDAKETIQTITTPIEFLLMDSDHSGEFCEWYIANVFPLVKKDAYVGVHDIFNSVNPQWGEIKTILEWLEKNEIEYFSPHKNLEELTPFRQSLGLTGVIHHVSDPAIFFQL